MELNARWHRACPLCRIIRSIVSYRLTVDSINRTRPAWTTTTTKRNRSSLVGNRTYRSHVSSTCRIATFTRRSITLTKKHGMTSEQEEAEQVGNLYNSILTTRYFSFVQLVSGITFVCRVVTRVSRH